MVVVVVVGSSVFVILVQTSCKSEGWILVLSNGRWGALGGGPGYGGPGHLYKAGFWSTLLVGLTGLSRKGGLTYGRLALVTRGKVLILRFKIGLFWTS